MGSVWPKLVFDAIRPDTARLTWVVLGQQKLAGVLAGGLTSPKEVKPGSSGTSNERELKVRVTSVFPGREGICVYNPSEGASLNFVVSLLKSLTDVNSVDLRNPGECP